MVKIKLLDYDQLVKAKHLLVYSYKNSSPIKIDGYIMEVDKKILQLLYDNNIKYEELD